MAESEVVRAIRKQREEVARNELDTLKRLARLWVPSYRYLREQVNALTALIRKKQDAGEPVEVEYFYSLERYQRMMAQAKKMVRDYNSAAAGQIHGTEVEMVELGKQNAQRTVSIAEPDDPMWTRVNKRETRIAAGMTANGSPLDRLLDKSFGQMKEGMEQALITGISTGQGSSWIADQLMKAAEIPEQRALLIARTEVNRAYRVANLETMRESRAVRGYRRMCYKDTACLACLMLDGEYYDKMEDFSDHPNGKCSAVPVTKHFDPANDPSWQKGRDWFMEQDEATQRRLMGAGRYELWKQQGVDPRDMVFVKPNPVWGGSPAVRSLSELIMGYQGGNQVFDLPSAAGINFQTEQHVQISGIDVVKSEGVRGMPDGKSGYLRTENCDIYATKDGMEFVFPKNLDKKLQVMTPEQVIQAWSNISADIRSKAQKRIIVVDYPNPNDSFWKKTYKNFTKSFSTGGINEITFYRSTNKHSISYIRDAIVHEIGHRIDTINGYFSSRVEWEAAMAIDAIRNGKKAPTVYGENSKREDFAESLVEFEKDRIGFEKVFTERAILIKILLRR